MYLLCRPFTPSYISSAASALQPLTLFVTRTYLHEQKIQLRAVCAVIEREVFDIIDGLLITLFAGIRVVFTLRANRVAQADYDETGFWVAGDAFELGDDLITNPQRIVIMVSQIPYSDPVRVASLIEVHLDKPMDLFVERLRGPLKGRVLVLRIPQRSRNLLSLICVGPRGGAEELIDSMKFGEAGCCGIHGA